MEHKAEIQKPLTSGTSSTEGALASARGRLDAAGSVCALMESVVDIIESTVSCDYVGLQTLSLPDRSAVSFAERQSTLCPISVSPARLRSLISKQSEARDASGAVDLQLAPKEAQSLFVASCGPQLSQGLLLVRSHEHQQLADLIVLGAYSSQNQLDRYRDFVDALLHQANLARIRLLGSKRINSEHRRIMRAKTEWQSSVDAMEQVICLVDREGSILRANRALEERGLGSVTRVTGRSFIETLNKLVYGAEASGNPESDPRMPIANRFTEQDWTRCWDQMTQGGFSRWTLESISGLQSYRVTLRPCEMGHALDDLSSSHAVAVVEDISAQEAAKRLIVNFKTELEREINLKTRQLRDANSRLAELSRQTLSVQEAERARVARDLHDGIGQSLTAMKVYIDNLIQNADAEKAAGSRDEIAWLGERVCNAISETRRVSMNLRPAILDDLGLGPALSWFLREYQQSLCNVIVKSRISIDEVHLNSDQKTAVFRIVQEALGNCAKYADAARVSVRLAPVDGCIRLEIDDNGNGFDLVNVSRRSRGHGLDNMRQRAAMTGGNLSLKTEPGNGVTIVADWPQSGAEPPEIDS